MAPRIPFVTQSGLADLMPLDEMAFRQWVMDNKVPFNPDAKGPTDYDMRGFWRGLQQGSPMAQTAVNPNDNRMHFTDYWKTPQHQTFSSESQWAGPNASQWINDSQLASPSGRVMFDEKAPDGRFAQLLAGLK
jgi:hypothetical protein